MEKVQVNLQEIKNAAHRIEKIVPGTPIKQSLFLSDRHGIPVFLKLENLNLSGSFKIRGAANALLSLTPDDLKRGVVAASAGNHAQGVAYISRLLNVHATIFMPERTPLVKVESTRSLGAKVVLTGQLYDDAYAAATKFQQTTGAAFIHPFADEKIINGQGTCGLEIFNSCPNLGLVLVAIGGGGLAAGVATALKALSPHVKVVGVQSKAFPSMKNSIAAGTIQAVPASTTIADGIAVKKPSPLTFNLLKDLLDDVVTVSDDQIAASIMELIEKDHMLAEGAGAASVSALHALDAYKKDLAGKSVCAIVSGGNIDVNLFNRITVRGLVHTGRMMRLIVRTEDRPGRLAEILNILGSAGANLLDVRHNRSFGALYYSDVDIEIDLETSSFTHQGEIRSALEKAAIAYRDFPVSNQI